MFTLNNITKSEDLSSYLVTSHACPMCGDRVTVSIAPEKLFAYNQGAYAQDVLSAYDADVREQFITGTCGTCWNSMFDFDDE